MNIANIERPAPRWYRRFVNATILFFIPMMTGVVQGLTMSSETRNVWMVAIVAIPFLLKGIGMILGNGEVYADISQIKQSEKEPVEAVKPVDK